MTREVATLERNDMLSVANNVMQFGRIRYMVVLDESGVMAGVVSQRDLFRGALVKALCHDKVADPRVMDSIPVKEVMATDLVTTTPDTPPSEAARLMAECRIGCLPVVEKDRLVGILTEGNLVAHVARLR